MQTSRYPEILRLNSEHVAWRRDLHAHPELAFEESRTAAFVADRLTSFGVAVSRGIGGTGVVGTLTCGRSGRAIGLRADMDALAMMELNSFEHRSAHAGRMHGCGHDGHMTMLLAAARQLASSRSFDGTVQFIFQPAEEANAIGSGAVAMMRDGLFERFPMDAVFGMHNFKSKGLKVGAIAVRPGPVMASMDLFDVEVKGTGAHGAMPHYGTDPIVAGAHLITAWQSIVSRNVDPLESAVVSATQFTAGDNWSVIPESAHLRGSIRALSPAVRETLEARFRSITLHTSAACGATATVTYRQAMPVLVNDATEAAAARSAAADVIGPDAVFDAMAPSMGSEDFAWLLHERPGAYVFIGNGEGPAACSVHQPHYDFNDEILATGASFWVRLVETRLAPRS